MSWLDYEGLSYYSEQLLPTIDGKAVEKNYSATLMASGWSSTVPYTQTVTVLGLAADDKPILDVDTSGATTATALANLNAAWLNTIKAVASNGLLTVTVSSAPTIDLPIKIKVFHGINTGGASSDEEFMEAVQGALEELDNNKLNTASIVDNLTSDDANKPLSAKQGKVLKELIDNQTGGDPTVVEITATELAAKNATQRAAMYTDGARLLKVTNGDTVVILSLASDGSTQWEASNKPLNNLLDNSNFANPVNQRGVTTHSGTGGGYGIDRWISTAAYTVSGGYIAASNAGTGTKDIAQMHESGTLKAGTVYTMAIKQLNGTIYCGNGTLEAGAWTEMVSNDNVMLAVAAASENLDRALIRLKAGTTLNLVWAALYEGAYTVDTMPPYAEKNRTLEYAKCLKYYKQCGGGWYYMLTVKGGGKWVIIPTEGKMRITPTAIINDFQIYVDGKGWVNASINYATYSCETYILNINYTDELSKEVSLIKGITALSAEL